MTPKLGQVTFGKELRKAEIEGFVLTETFHPPNLFLPRHDHECANLNFTLKGSFRKTFGSRPQEATTSSILIKPAGESHANQYGNSDTHCLIIEVRPSRLKSIRNIQIFSKNRLTFEMEYYRRSLSEFTQNFET